MAQVTDLLRQSPVLESLSPADLARLAERARVQSIPQGNVIFEEGAPSDACYWVASGCVEIRKKSGIPGRTDKVLAILETGSFFGETALVAHSARTASAVAAQNTEVVEIPGESFREFLMSDREVGVPLSLEFLRNIIDRLRQTSQELALIYETGRLLSSERPFAETARFIVQSLQTGLLDVEEACLFLRNPHWDELECVATSGSEALPRLPMGTAFVKHLAERRGLLPFSQGETLSQLLPTGSPWQKAGYLLIAPLDIQGTLEGMLVLTSAKPTPNFYRDVRTLLPAISLLLAEAIVNLRHREEEQARQRLAASRLGYTF